MHKIEFNNITRKFPAEIEEMTESQYRYFCFLEMNRQLGKISMARLEVLLVYYIMDMERVSNSPKVIENVNELRKLVKPYYTQQKSKGKTVDIVDLNFLENPLPIISLKVDKEIKEFYGPMGALQDCEYAQLFLHAHNAYYDFSKTMDDAHLDTLVATLYLPKGAKFKFKEVEKRAEELSGLRPEVKFGVYLFFASCMKFLANCKEFPIGGGITLDFSSLFKTEAGTVKHKGIGPLGVIYSLAESGVFGDHKKTGRENAISILIRLIQLEQQAKDLKKNDKAK